MSKKLFVGSLSWNTDDQGLRAAFEVHGEIEEATVVADRDTGRSRGFGFVTFADDESADKAIAALNHPHICTLFDVGHEDGTDFLVMERLEGESLQDPLKKGALPVGQALQIADALDKAHRRGSPTGI